VRKRDKRKEYLLLRHDESMFARSCTERRSPVPRAVKPAGVRGVIIDLNRTQKRGAGSLRKPAKAGTRPYGRGCQHLGRGYPHNAGAGYSPWLFRTLGYQPADLPDITISVCKNLIHPLDIPRVMAAFVCPHVRCQSFA